MSAIHNQIYQINKKLFSGYIQTGTKNSPQIKFVATFGEAENSLIILTPYNCFFLTHNISAHVSLALADTSGLPPIQTESPPGLCQTNHDCLVEGRYNIDFYGLM